MTADIARLVTALDHNFENKEINANDNSLSGTIYVSMRDHSDGTACKVFLLTPERCGHQNRVCAACVYSWGWDHQIAFDRTAGGRKLKKQLESYGLDPNEIAHGRGKRPSSPTV